MPIASQPVQYNPVQYRQPGQLGAYLLGRGPVPPPHPAEVAVAVANHLIDHPNDDNDSGDEEIDPQLRLPAPAAPPIPSLVVAPPRDARIVVCVPINNQVVRDIEFPLDVDRGDFMNRIHAAMSLDPATAQLGWKTNDAGKRDPSQPLNTHGDIDNAFRTIVNIICNPRRRREVIMLITHLNPTAVPALSQKKADANRTTDLSYNCELRLVQEKLKCAEHPGPGRWCYISPNHPTEHVALALEEISLWARKIKIKDNEADKDCVMPPNCLVLDKLCQRARSGTQRRSKVTSHFTPPPMHFHFGDAFSTANIANQASTSSGPMPRSLKRSRTRLPSSDDDSSDSDDESLTLEDLFNDLHVKFPKLNLLQYLPILAEQGIMYVESVTDFDREYFLQLGMAEGAVGPFLKGVNKALWQQKRDKKRAKLQNKENDFCRIKSVEL